MSEKRPSIRTSTPERQQSGILHLSTRPICIVRCQGCGRFYETSTPEEAQKAAREHPEELQRNGESLYGHAVLIISATLVSR